MKKLLSIALFILTAFIANATDRYISPTGNNANAGTLAAPWRTLAYAGTNTVSGDIIHVLAGTYNETAQCILKTGVSIVGVGVTSNIVYTYTGGECISLTGVDGTNGNQSISYIKLDGSNLTAKTAILVLARSNVKVFNCTIQNFEQNGVIFNGSNNFGQPTVYMTGCELYNCTITNNSDRYTGGQGNIVATGYRTILIHDNVITQTSRPIGHNGNIMSATTAGYSEGLKYYNNISYRNDDEGVQWAFHLELWDSQGNMEVYGNEFHGGNQMIDWGGSDSPVLGILPGVYSYAAYVHDNLFQFDTPIITAPQYQDVAINLEGNVNKVIITNNHFKNCPYGVQMTLEHSTTGQKNITINNNLFENSGYVNAEWGFDIDILTKSSGACIADSITIINNTFITNSLSALFIYMNTSNTVKNVTFTNNIVQGVRDYGYIAFDNGGNQGVKSNFSVRNNNLYQNANSNAVSLLNGSTLPTSSTFTGSIIGNPLLDASFYLTASSPAINAGVNVGLPYCGSAPDIGWKEYCPTSTPPVANAGVDQTITLPVSSVILSGTATTTGSIVAWNWQSVGAGSPTIGTSNAQTTTASGLVAGTYLFMLTVTDNSGLQDTDTMQVTVNAAPAIAPSCNSGTTPVTITLPTSSVALTGTAASSPVSNGYTVLWERTVGTAGATITNAALLSTTVTGLTAQTYNFRITVTDAVNGLTCQSTKVVTVNPAPVVPTANAGANQVITLPTNSVSLSGSGSGGTINSYQWTVLSGIGGTFSAATSASTNFTGLSAGTYQVRFRVGNTDGNFGYDTVQITVNPAIVLPTATCNPNITITLPTNSCTLTGVATGTQVPFSYQWTKLSGTGGNLTTPTVTSTTFTGLVAGVYSIEYRVTDNNGNIARDTMSVTVNPAPVVPTANAGANQVITLPTNSVSLSGSGSGGTINSYQWTVLSGIGGTLSAATSANTNLTGLSAGTYKVQLRVGNTDGNFGYDTVQITVNPAIVLPTANAGADVSILLPTNFAALNGVATGTQTPFSYQWTKLTGTGGSITSPISAVTQATGLTAGVYTYEFRVTDNNGNIARDTMSITVTTPILLPPIVSAGTNQVLYTPASSTTLSGSVVLGSGTVSSYEWTQISGAVTTILSYTTISTGITGLTIGTYVYRLTVITTDGFTVYSDVTVTVSDVILERGFKYINAVLINGKSNISWGFYGTTSGTSFTVQKKSWWWYNNIGTVRAITGTIDYQFIDSNTKSGTSTYRVKYGSDYSKTVTVKKN